MMPQLGAARVRWLMTRHLSNWKEVWASFRSGSANPPIIRFRNGLLLRGRALDTPILLFFEVFANRCYRRLADSQGLVVDVGANVGAFTLDCLHRHPATFIHAYEPDPETFAMLQENIERNGFGTRVRLWNEAVGQREGTVPFVRDAISICSRIGPSSLSVPCVTLDTVIRRTRHVSVDVLKLDVEGAEADILEAGRGVLPGYRRVLGEYHEQFVPGVRQRVEAALEKTHACEFVHLPRCSSMFVGAARR